MFFLKKKKGKLKDKIVKTSLGERTGGGKEEK